MSVYLYFVCRPDGVASTFDVAELDGDAAARAHGRRVLRDHPSCARIVVETGGRRIAVLTA